MPLGQGPHPAVQVAGLVQRRGVGQQAGDEVDRRLGPTQPQAGLVGVLPGQGPKLLEQARRSTDVTAELPAQVHGDRTCPRPAVGRRADGVEEGPEAGRPAEVAAGQEEKPGGLWYVGECRFRGRRSFLEDGGDDSAGVAADGVGAAARGVRTAAETLQHEKLAQKVRLQRGHCLVVRRPGAGEVGDAVPGCRVVDLVGQDRPALGARAG